LSDISYATDGTMTWPSHATTAPPGALAGYQEQARELLAATDAPDLIRHRADAEDFAGLRWFVLPDRCLPE